MSFSAHCTKKSVNIDFIASNGSVTTFFAKSVYHNHERVEQIIDHKCNMVTVLTKYQIYTAKVIFGENVNIPICQCTKHLGHCTYNSVESLMVCVGQFPC